MQKKPITIDENLCTLCGLCVNICLGKVLEKQEEIINIGDTMRCNLCGHCVSICTADAIMAGKQEPIPLPEEKPVTPEEMVLLIRSRRSTRLYKKEPVPKEVVEQIIEAGRFAPTGGNMQGIHFTVVEDPQTLEAVRQGIIDNLDKRVSEWEALAEAYEKHGTPIPVDLVARVANRSNYRLLVDTAREGQDPIFHRAPQLVVIHSDPTSGSPKDDGDLMAMCMLLMAESMGLGTCLLGLFNVAARLEESIRELIELPKGHEVVASFIMGYPAVKFRNAPARKPARISWM
jgi:nitroreductase/NAD-dependent dihydropyrimidine dehydrogenase PreA subunit